VLATQQPAMTTRDARLTPWSLLVALGVDGTAKGRFVDSIYHYPPEVKLMHFQCLPR
jgi:hypothetical protein